MYNAMNKEFDMQKARGKRFYFCIWKFYFIHPNLQPSLRWNLYFYSLSRTAMITTILKTLKESNTFLTVLFRSENNKKRNTLSAWLKFLNIPDVINHASGGICELPCFLDIVSSLALSSLLLRSIFLLIATKS